MIQSMSAAETLGNDTPLPFSLPAVCRKKVTAAFDGGLMSSDGGVLLLAQIERRLRIAERLAACIEDPRDRERVLHGLAEMICYRALLIAGSRRQRLRRAQIRSGLQDGGRAAAAERR
jgi:hypothetical protein